MLELHPNINPDPFDKMDSGTPIEQLAHDELITLVKHCYVEIIQLRNEITKKELAKLKKMTHLLYGDI